MFNWFKPTVSKEERLLVGLNTLFAQLELLGHIEEVYGNRVIKREWLLRTYSRKDGYHVERYDYYGGQEEPVRHLVSFNKVYIGMYVGERGNQPSQYIRLKDVISQKRLHDGMMIPTLKDIHRCVKRMGINKTGEVSITVMYPPPGL